MRDYRPIVQRILTDVNINVQVAGNLDWGNLISTTNGASDARLTRRIGIMAIMIS